MYQTEYSKIQRFKYLTFNDLKRLKHSKTQRFKHLNVQRFKHSNIYIALRTRLVPMQTRLRITGRKAETCLVASHTRIPRVDQTIPSVYQGHRIFISQFVFFSITFETTISNWLNLQLPSVNRTIGQKSRKYFSHPDNPRLYYRDDKRWYLSSRESVTRADRVCRRS